MNNRHPWQLKKSKFWGLFWSYQLNNTANSAYSPRKWAKWAGSSETAPTILIFSIAMGTYSFELISIVH
jgi:hypothetical protein